MSPVRLPRSYSGAPDVVGYSRLMGVDEAATLQRRRRVGARWLIRRLPRSRADVSQRGPLD
jgi:hypothetical protein